MIALTLLSILSIICSLTGAFMLLLSNSVLDTCTKASQAVIVIAVIAALLAFDSQGWLPLFVSVLCFVHFIATYRRYQHTTAGA